MSVFSLGMMIETMAGKSAALHGLCHDCTPFTFSEDSPAVDYFGKLLVKGRRELVKTNNSRLNGRHWRATQSDSSSCCINIDHLVTSAFIQNLDPISSFFTRFLYFCI